LLGSTVSRCVTFLTGLKSTSATFAATWLNRRATHSPSVSRMARRSVEPGAEVMAQQGATAARAQPPSRKPERRPAFRSEAFLTSLEARLGRRPRPLPRGPTRKDAAREDEAPGGEAGRLERTVVDLPVSAPKIGHGQSGGGW